jgi:hypothetical protein
MQVVQDNACINGECKEYLQSFPLTLRHKLDTERSILVQIEGSFCAATVRLVKCGERECGGNGNGEES